MTINLNQEKLPKLVNNDEDYYINLLKKYNEFKDHGLDERRIWAEDYFEIGGIYTYNKFYLTLGGRTDGCLYRYGLKMDGVRISSETNLLFLRIERTETTNFIDCLIFFYDNQVWSINVLEGIYYKKLETND